jgi:branched-chain amino acid transport system substrate-binding protein
MRDRRRASRRAGRRGTKGLALVAVTVLLLAITACGGDDDASDGSGGGDGNPELDVAGLLGPEDQATGDPVKIGMVSDGQSQAYDNTDELRAAKAAADYWNEHKGGIAGRPIQIETCETNSDPAKATDCANQLVEKDVVAVAVSQSAVTDSLWGPLHDAGIPSFFLQASGTPAMATDTESTYFVFNPLSSLMGLPISVAQNTSSDKIDFVLIDVPQAVTGFEQAGPPILGAQDIDYDLVKVPPGTADMTSQMQQVVSNGAGVVQVVGNDAFCIAAFQGLNAVGYTGKITTLAQCITDATKEAVPDLLDGMYLQGSYALGANDDPTYQLYLAVMQQYGDDVSDVENGTALGGYTAAASLFTAMAGVTGDITADSANAAIKAMPESDLPAGGGMTFQCGGSASPVLKPVCTNQFLQATLSAGGDATDYEVVDSSDIVQL